MRSAARSSATSTSTAPIASRRLQRAVPGLHHPLAWGNVWTRDGPRPPHAQPASRSPRCRARPRERARAARARRARNGLPPRRSPRSSCTPRVYAGVPTANRAFAIVLANLRLRSSAPRSGGPARRRASAQLRVANESRAVTEHDVPSISPSPHAGRRLGMCRPRVGDGLRSTYASSAGSTAGAGGDVRSAGAMPKIGLHLEQRIIAFALGTAGPQDQRRAARGGVASPRRHWRVLVRGLNTRASAGADRAAPHPTSASPRARASHRRTEPDQLTASTSGA